MTSVVGGFTEYIEPVKTEKLWLVDGEVRLVPFSQDGKQYEYPIVLNSKWSSIPMQPAPNSENAFSMSPRNGSTRNPIRKMCRE